MIVDKITQSQGFITFVETAKNFCSFIETKQSNSYQTFLATIQKQLIELYIYGAGLPEFSSPKDRDIKEVGITDKDIKEILLLIRDRINDPFYWTVFDPTDHNDTASVCGDLTDDLGDIYKDLKTFLIEFEKGDDNVKQNALWQLKWSFDYHWNDHCMDAIYAIHYFLKNEKER